MGYTATIEGFEGQNIEVQSSMWTGPKLLVDGQRAQKGTRRGEMLLQRNDGRQVVAAWKPQAIGLDVPQLVVDGKTIQFVEPLKWYQWLWGGLPIVLIFIGGALGAFFGVVAFSISTKIFRSELNGFAKFILSAIVSAIAVVLYLFLATLIRSSLSG